MGVLQLPCVMVCEQIKGTWIVINERVVVIGSCCCWFSSIFSIDSQRSSLSTIDMMIMSSQHYVELPRFALPGWCNCCPDPSEMFSLAPKEMSAADLTLLNNKNALSTTVWRESLAIEKLVN